MSILVDLFHIYLFLAFYLKFIDKVTMYNIEIFDYRLDEPPANLNRTTVKTTHDEKSKMYVIRELVS